jgi:cytochrome P450
MLAHGEATRNMPPFEYLGNVLLLIVGGNDTTRNSITGGLLRPQSQNPAEEAKLRADPSLIPNMVSEIIRWQTPLAYMRRTAIEDFELSGKTIRKGDKVVMWYVSGNRDETVIDNRQRLPDRPPPSPLPSVVRLRHPPLRRQPPGRAAAEDHLGGDPQALPEDRGDGRAEAGLFELREGV